MKKDVVLLTKKEALEYLRISHDTLQRLMKNRAFPFIKLKKKVLFRRSDIEKWLESKIVK